MTRTAIVLALASFTTIAAAQPAVGKQPAPTPPPATKPTPPTPVPPAPRPPVPPPSAESCFELSRDGKLWSRTPEQLCIGAGDKAVAIKLTTGMPTPQTVATFTLDLTARARCIDCNKDVFSLSNPENSVFNQLAIKFNGKRDAKAPGKESGTLTIGATKFFYRKQ